MCPKLLQVAEKVPRVMHLSLESPNLPTLGKHGDETTWKKSNKMPHSMGANIYSNPLIKVLLNLPTKCLKFIAFGFFQMECC